MPNTFLSLPTEIQLSILRHLPSRDLLLSTRIVSVHFRSLSHDILLTETLPTIRIDLNVWDEGNHQEYLPSKNVQLQYHFSHVEDDAHVTTCTLRAVEPEARRQRVLRLLRQPNVVRHAMQMSLGRGYVVAMKDNSWFEAPVWRAGPKWKGIGEVLMWDWKRVLGKYFKATKNLEDVSEKRSDGVSQFSLY
ncbi:hypothetical protein DOTSEDRAFT_70405 [Dothistroma septosporum NZE10]|uniref:F-box domain-containing protein n=1 Tax=Dothistroma septosporum (strain NZE10 / CBS 128990) TaxID=675120 RepID=N1PVE9_DOTSN|nr:hypothetical protein DOTSEDRAFT_70405 [Dothistroma septosporum NZE10]